MYNDVHHLFSYIGVSLVLVFSVFVVARRQRGDGVGGGGGGAAAHLLGQWEPAGLSKDR